MPTTGKLSFWPEGDALASAAQAAAALAYGRASARPEEDTELALLRITPGTPFVVLDRCDDLDEDKAEYVLVGRTICVGGRCGHWVWLGSETYKIVQAGEAIPLCIPCGEAGRAGPVFRRRDPARDRRRPDKLHD